MNVPPRFGRLVASEEERDVAGQQSRGETSHGRDFAAVFDRLKDVLEPYGRRMHVAADSPDVYAIDMAPEAERNPTTWFGGVRIGKAYVSYYLMPVYVEPALLEGVSPELLRRMQGKSCFNFSRVHEELFAELAGLTRRSFERTAGDPAWGAVRREEHGMAHRKAMSESRRPAGTASR
jgi:hypothetical protein